MERPHSNRESTHTIATITSNATRALLSAVKKTEQHRGKKENIEELRGQHTKQEQCNTVKAGEQHFNGRKPSKVMLP